VPMTRASTNTPIPVSFLGTNVIGDNVPDDCVGSPDC
jgi:hypothetical protein